MEILTSYAHGFSAEDMYLELLLLHPNDYSSKKKGSWSYSEFFKIVFQTIGFPLLFCVLGEKNWRFPSALFSSTDNVDGKFYGINYLYLCEIRENHTWLLPVSYYLH